MSKLLEALGTIPPIVRDLDFTELDAAYIDPESGDPLKLQYRVNWTRAQKRRRWELAAELRKIQQEAMGQEASADGIEKRVLENTEGWLSWWADILPEVSLEEVKELQAQGFLWEWLTSAVVQRVEDYEVDATKKVRGGPLATSEAQQADPPKSGSESTSADS